MTRQLIECVPNFSEGRRDKVIEEIRKQLEIKAAELLSQRDKLLNSATYQEILTLTGKEVKQFVDLGRFTNYSLTKNKFSEANVNNGKFVIANAWSAYYVGDAGGVQVYGTLYITV